MAIYGCLTITNLIVKLGVSLMLSLNKFNYFSYFTCSNKFKLVKFDSMRSVVLVAMSRFFIVRLLKRHW